MDPQSLTAVGLLAASLVVTMINTVIIATTKAAVSDLRADMLQQLAPKDAVQQLDCRMRNIEISCARNHHADRRQHESD